MLHTAPLSPINFPHFCRGHYATTLQACSKLSGRKRVLSLLGVFSNINIVFLCAFLPALGCPGVSALRRFQQGLPMTENKPITRSGQPRAGRGAGLNSLRLPAERPKGPREPRADKPDTSGKLTSPNLPSITSDRSPPPLSKTAAFEQERKRFALPRAPGRPRPLSQPPYAKP